MASRRSALCRISSPGISVGCSCASLVLPSISVKRKVTVPEGTEGNGFWSPIGRNDYDTGTPFWKLYNDNRFWMLGADWLLICAGSAFILLSVPIHLPLGSFRTISN